MAFPMSNEVDPHRSTDTQPQGKVFVYRGNVPLWLGALLAAPLLVFAFSLIAALMIGGVALAVLLPLLAGRRRRQPPTDDMEIEIESGQYRRVDESQRRLPPE